MYRPLASQGDNTNHRVSMRFEYKIDSANQLIITPTLGFQNSSSLSRVGTRLIDSSQAAISTTNTINNSSRKGNNLSNSILYRHAFPKRGRSFSVNLQTGYNRKTGNVYTDFFDTTYTTGSDYTDSLSQRYTNQLSNGYQVSANFVYTEPISKTAQLQVNYSPSYTKVRPTRKRSSSMKHQENIPSSTRVCQISSPTIPRVRTQVWDIGTSPKIPSSISD